MDDNFERILEDDKDATNVMPEDHLPCLKWWEEAERKNEEEGDKMLDEQAALERGPSR
jgi:hypothetical protein